MKMHALKNPTMPTPRKSLLPLLISAILGTSGVVAVPLIHAAPTLPPASESGAPTGDPSPSGAGTGADASPTMPKRDTDPQADASAQMPENGVDPRQGDAPQADASGADGRDQGQGRRDQDRQVAQVSQEGLQAMQSLHAARLAIFEGQTDAAKTKVGQAEQLLTEARSSAATLERKVGDTNGGNGDAGGDAVASDGTNASGTNASGTNASGTNASGKGASAKDANGDGSQSDDLYVPIDGTIALSDAFVPTEENKPALDKANKQLSGKDTAAALDTLKLAEIDVRYTEVLMPLNRTEQHVKEAKDLIEQGKFYEANLAMREAEQGIVVNRFEIDGAPPDGGTPTDG